MRDLANFSDYHQSGSAEIKQVTEGKRLYMAIQAMYLMIGAGEVFPHIYRGAVCAGDDGYTQ